MCCPSSKIFCTHYHSSTKQVKFAVACQHQPLLEEEEEEEENEEEEEEEEEVMMTMTGTTR